MKNCRTNVSLGGLLALPCALPINRWYRLLRGVHQQLHVFPLYSQVLEPVRAEKAPKQIRLQHLTDLNVGDTKHHATGKCGGTGRRRMGRR